MIDPMLSLAFSMHANKGVYALLLGSGVSRSAGIPTGWEVVLDLVRKLAHMRGENCEPEPEVPDYAKLLDAIAKSPSERNQLLRSYFEPNEKERERGLKLPTEGHRKIASLVASGHVRVIVTTNFDCLMERALEAVGVTPTVIRTPDAAEGALPLTHTPCTVIKVHGDYIDTRIKNTPAELSEYDERINQLLDRVFDEFGLIVCGWSAEWDVALRAAMERCKSHRFTTYWAIRGEPGQAAKGLIHLRRATEIRIQDADTFFTEMEEKVSALAEYDKPHPLSAKVAVETLKRYLVEERHRIRLADLVRQEREKLYDAAFDFQSFNPNVKLSPEELNTRMQRYEELTETLLSVMITGCYWGEETHDAVWVETLERIANPPNPIEEPWSRLRLYPALLLLYGGGIASIAAEKYHTFSALLTKAKRRIGTREKVIVNHLNPECVMDAQIAGWLEGIGYTPYAEVALSKHIRQNSLRDAFRELLPQDTRYEACFDRFEYFFALVHIDLYCEKQETINLKGYELFRGFSFPRDPHLIEPIMLQIEQEIEATGETWPPLHAGLFNGSLERAKAVKRGVDEFLRQYNP